MRHHHACVAAFLTNIIVVLVSLRCLCHCGACVTAALALPPTQVWRAMTREAGRRSLLLQQRRCPWSWAPCRWAC